MSFLLAKQQLVLGGQTETIKVVQTELGSGGQTETESDVKLPFFPVERLFDENLSFHRWVNSSNFYIFKY